MTIERYCYDTSLTQALSELSIGNALGLYKCSDQFAFREAQGYGNTGNETTLPRISRLR